MVEVIKRIYHRINGYLLKKSNPGLIVVGDNVSIKGCDFEGYNAIHSESTLNNCHIGLCSYIGLKSNLSYVKVGKFCSIADNVNTCLGNHPTHYLTTHPAFYYDTTNQLGYSFYQGGVIYLIGYIFIHKVKSTIML